MNEIMVKDFTKDGKCSSCGQCCSNCLPLSEKEIKRIKTYIKQHNIKEQRHNVAASVDMTCPFRDEANRKCTIYEIRPEICRSFICNYKKEDIEKNRIEFHKNNRVVFMRNEFFGNTEDVDFLFSVLFGGIHEG